jgi:hypothetical protein
MEPSLLNHRRTPGWQLSASHGRAPVARLEKASFCDFEAHPSTVAACNFGKEQAGVR